MERLFVFVCPEYSPAPLREGGKQQFYKWLGILKVYHMGLGAFSSITLCIILFIPVS